MLDIKYKSSLSILVLCLVSVFGLKDTGVFVSAHEQPTYSGNKVCFEAGEQANIIDSSERGYIVEKGKAKVTIPYEKIQLTEKTTRIYKVIKNTSIRNDKNEIIRNLFIGEELVEISKNNETVKVECKDGTKGNVSVESLKLESEKKENFEVKTNAVKVNVEPVKAEYIKNTNIQNVKMTTISKEEFKMQDSPVVYTSDKAKVAVDSALDKLGSTYVYGDTGKAGYDCSGLVYAVYKNQLGINLPRSSSDQSTYGKQVSKAELQAGDLIFFNTSGKGVSHVGIYMGNGEFVHASSGQSKVVVSNLSEDYYSSRFVNATRVLD
ncbi:C40 family peptidase [Peptoniphilus catoniae]|uniref:C40 family peptidase n=1 Tax=Peptoniphilus catoniae TaxID=1660341 RepID=UPI0010FE2A72|nr:C40 family peptidase [Peptoniphilus catoniae]